MSHGCRGYLGHPQGLREQHPDDVIEHSTFSSTLTLHIVCFIPCLSQKIIFDPQGLREQHSDGEQYPGGIHQDSTLPLTLTFEYKP